MAWRPVARCMPSVLRIRPRPASAFLQPALPQSSWHARIDGPSFLQHKRQPFSISTATRDSKSNDVERDNAQRKVDDRPWQRLGNLTEEESKHLSKDRFQGRVLTTPTRLLKLIIPMPFYPTQKYIEPGKEPESGTDNTPGKVVEPLALLAHPQQPLSYVERLIQAEIPPVLIDGREKLPEVIFRAEADQKKSHDRSPRNGDNVAQYSGLGHEGPKRDHTDWVRWSGSTEVGDFIRDAARGREFEIHIEGCPDALRIAVPSFNDRTYYMRARLRQMSSQVNNMAKIKNDCDQLAHKGAHRIAQGGFVALAGWWAVVYYVTFHTEMGWDLVEPVTYLAGLTTIMGGYLWFLYMSKDLSYRAAMNVTVSRRQSALYQERGFDQTAWEHLVHEANSLRREIKIVANEYGVDWDETKDLGGEEIKEVLESEKQKKDKIKDAEVEEENDDDRTKSEEKKTPR